MSFSFCSLSGLKRVVTLDEEIFIDDNGSELDSDVEDALEDDMDKLTDKVRMGISYHPLPISPESLDLLL